VHRPGRAFARILAAMPDPIETLAGRIATLRGGNLAPQRGWTLAQAIAHCAQSIECSMTGYPELRSVLFRVTIGPLAKRKFLRDRKMSHDVSAPVPGAPPIDPSIALDAACDRADAALRSFTAFDGTLAPHLAYGRCTKPEYAQLHLLHFEDHARAFGV
jgi:hypothetical protein